MYQIDALELLNKYKKAINIINCCGFCPYPVKCPYSESEDMNACQKCIDEYLESEEEIE